eukprot:1578782-Pyramimonas_sp.AAC.1
MSVAGGRRVWEAAVRVADPRNRTEYRRNRPGPATRRRLVTFTSPNAEGRVSAGARVRRGVGGAWRPATGGAAPAERAGRARRPICAAAWEAPPRRSGAGCGAAAAYGPRLGVPAGRAGPGGGAGGALRDGGGALSARGEPRSSGAGTRPAGHQGRHAGRRRPRGGAFNWRTTIFEITKQLWGVECTI